MPPAHVSGRTRSSPPSAPAAWARCTARATGVEPILVDVFDAPTLTRLLSELRPEVVIHQLTDLPYALEAGAMTAALVRNARLRDEGTRNLVSAAVAAGAKRLIAQSISFIYADGPSPKREADPLLPITHPVYGETVQGVLSLERQVLGGTLVASRQSRERGSMSARVPSA